jgi:nucleoside-diphosphate-sugar epimerase
MNVLVTGARGFIGRPLCAALLAARYRAIAAVRDASRPLPAELSGAELRFTGAIGPDTDWHAALEGVDAVVHLANLAHESAEPGVFQRVNVDGTRRLAQAASQAGITRFIYVSSIKVHGEVSGPAPFTEDSPLSPQTAYALSKYEAEQALNQVFGEGERLVIFRPPLVYGPFVRANFLSLMRIVERGLPVPVASRSNTRSLVFVGNLVDAIVHALRDSPIGKGVWTLSDGKPVSTAGLVRELAAAMGRSPRVLTVPLPLLTCASTLLGRRADLERLTGSLEVDDAKIRNQGEWRPPFTLQQGLESTAAWFLKR